MEIRKAIHADAVAGTRVLRRSISELCTADHGGDKEAIAAWCANKTPEMWMLWIDQEATEPYVAVDAGSIVGVGMLGRTGEIMLNYVSPDSRWRGVSKAMLTHMETEARTKHLWQCTLASTKTARAFYNAAGYVPTGIGDELVKKFIT
ncbi:GNAT family N-acetyltransferase [Devosia algicola]|uniref:GNAT family N-acetyltransferase n=1 Tax=Devosia algicola TaxID=3026418 RepID=A0ABY7YRT2_9HYPH|nr:GNAT family N-acetyltransferase [Devosia algicola]WDR04040.1 GNAT family N-acetyltransferase [Devosia algicola]